MDAMLRQALRKYRGLRQQVDNVLLGEDGDVWEAELRKWVARRPCWVSPKGDESEISNHLLIPFQRKFLIGPTGTDGPLEVQADYISPGPLTQAVIYSYGVKPEDLCLTDAQIRRFCREHSKELFGCVCFFLERVRTMRHIGTVYDVACAVLTIDGLIKSRRSFADCQIDWSAGEDQYFVLPKQG